MTSCIKFGILYTDKREETLQNLERKKMNKVKFFTEILDFELTADLENFAREQLEKEIELERKNQLKNERVRAEQIIEETLILEFLKNQKVLTPTSVIKNILEENKIRPTKSTAIMKRLIDAGQVEKGYMARQGGKPLTAYRMVYLKFRG